MRDIKRPKNVSPEMWFMYRSCIRKRRYETHGKAKKGGHARIYWCPNCRGYHGTGVAPFDNSLGRAIKMAKYGQFSAIILRLK